MVVDQEAGDGMELLAGDRPSAATDPSDRLLENAICLGVAWRTIRRSRTGILASATSGIIDPRLEAGDVDTLVHISSTGESRMSEIAAGLQIVPSTATRAVDRLVERGLATRRRDANDGRVVRISLTDDGLRVQAIARYGRHAFAARLLERFDPDDQDAIAALMPRLALALAEELGVER